jgi:Helix-turn-helix domain
MMRLGWYRAVHVKDTDMQKMRSPLAYRKLLKRKLIDIENHIRGTLRAYGLLVGAVARGAHEARVRELLERCDPIFVMTIEAMLDVRRAIFEGFERLHKVVLLAVQHDHSGDMGYTIRPFAGERKMPWKECNQMDERLKFIARLPDGDKMAVVCRDFNVSRKTGYEILKRYNDVGLEGLTDRSRRPCVPRWCS